MRAGDAHGPDRIFDVEVAFDDDGIVKSMKMRALDNVGAYAGRSPLQLGKPIGAIVGPYKIQSVQYQPIASPRTRRRKKRCAASASRRPISPSKPRSTRSPRPSALDRIEVRRRNFIRSDEFPYLDPERHALRQRRLSDRGRQGAGARRLRGLIARTRRAARIRPAAPASALPLPGAERRQLGLRAAVQREERDHDLDGSLPHQSRSGRRRHRVDHPHDVVGAGPRDPGGDRHRRGSRERSRPDPHRASDRSTALPSNSPVGSRMAIMLGGAAFQARRSKLKAKIVRHRRASIRRARRMRDLSRRQLSSSPAIQRQTLSWDELVEIAHRKFHKLPPGIEPGLQATHVWEVPTGGDLPTADGRVQMYPCYAFECHVVLVEFDRVRRPRRYPAICRGS